VSGGIRTQRHRSRISAQEAAFIELALQADSPITRKQALQRLCDLTRRGGVLGNAKRMKSFVFSALVDRDEKVRRWAFNAMAQIGEEADISLMLQPWKDNRQVPGVFAAGLTALAHLVEKERLLSILETCEVGLNVEVLMALGQQTDAFSAELSEIHLNIDNATSDELTQATLLIGLKKAPASLFSPRFAVSDVIGDLNMHADPIIAQYSFWATVEHPDLGLENTRVLPSNFSQLPPNVQGWAYRTLTKDGTLAMQHYDSIVEASESTHLAVREGIAIGLRHIFYDSLDITVSDWFLDERSEEVRHCLLDHMATHITKSSAYRDEVIKAYRDAATGSVLRSRLEAANRDDAVSLEMRRIDLQMSDPTLFASLTGPTMNNTMNFNGTVNAAGISNSGIGNSGQVQIVSSAEALAAITPVLQQLLQTLEGHSAPAKAAEGAKLVKEAVAAPTKGNVTRVFDWLKKFKEGGDAISGISTMVVAAYDKIGPLLDHLPAVLG
jgi:hypothetical protein